MKYADVPIGATYECWVDMHRPRNQYVKLCEEHSCAPEYAHDLQPDCLPGGYHGLERRVPMTIERHRRIVEPPGPGRVRLVGTSWFAEHACNNVLGDPDGT